MDPNQVDRSAGRELNGRSRLKQIAVGLLTALVHVHLVFSTHGSTIDQVGVELRALGRAVEIDVRVAA